MAKAFDRYGIIFQNLTDVGCEKETAEKCTELILAEKYEQALALIKPQKKRLLEEIHANQKRVDSIDFLVSKLRNYIPASIKERLVILWQISKSSNLQTNGIKLSRKVRRLITAR